MTDSFRKVETSVETSKQEPLIVAIWKNFVEDCNDWLSAMKKCMKYSCMCERNKTR